MQFAKQTTPCEDQNKKENVPCIPSADLTRLRD